MNARRTSRTNFKEIAALQKMAEKENSGGKIIISHQHQDL